MMAGQGHVVCVPEVYHEYEPAGTVLAYDRPGTDRGNFLKFEKPLQGYDGDARAVLDWLEASPYCTGALATMGYAWAGTWLSAPHWTRGSGLRCVSMPPTSIPIRWGTGKRMIR